MSCEFPDDARFTLARAVILEAGTLAAVHFADIATLEVERKLNGQDVVSRADRAVEDLIRTRLLAGFPDDGFLGEESGMAAGSSGHLWVVDPIDGTSCFLHGLDSWCISVALLQGDRIELGLILHPASGELFVAARGRGALLNGRRISVDTEGAIGSGLLGLGANLHVAPARIGGFATALLAAGGMFWRNGSGALMLAYVACGRLIGYYEPHIHAWDCLAGLCLIREAGGWLGDFPGGPDLTAGGPVAVAAPQVRDELLSLIATADRVRP